MYTKNNNDIILIGFGESLSAPEVAWDLIDHGFKIAAFCRQGSAPPIRHIKNIKIIEVIPPEKDAWQTVDQIRKASHFLKAKTVLPLDDASIWLCDKAAEVSDIVVAGAMGCNAQLALNKKIQLESARACGFNVPETVYIEDKQDLLKINQFPVVIKPASAVSEKDGKLCKGPIIFCVDKEDLINAVNEYVYDGKLIVQPILEGTGEGIFGLNGPHGVKNWSAHRRIRTVNPLGSGSCACKSLKISDHPIVPAERMLKNTNWPGMFMIELLRDSSGRLWFMELNGRSWGSMALAIRLGLHYPAWTVMQTIDSSFEPPEPPPWESIVCRHLGREFIHLLSVLKGKKAFKLIPKYSRIRTFLEVFRFNRDEKWYNWRPGNALLFWEDTVKTVMWKLLKGRGSH